MGDPEQPSVVQSNMILDFTPVAMLKHCQKCCKIHPYFLTVLFISLSFNVNIGDLNISYWMIKSKNSKGDSVGVSYIN
jgi:hypothetical protein